MLVGGAQEQGEERRESRSTWLNPVVLIFLCLQTAADGEKKALKVQQNLKCAHDSVLHKSLEL